MVEHNLSVVHDLADRVTVLAAGACSPTDYGEVSRTPPSRGYMGARVTARARRRPSSAELLRVSRSRFYGESHILHAWI